MKDRPALDVTFLPTMAFGSRGLVWWWTIGFIAIETTMLAICWISYFYLRGRADEWPPGRKLPELLLPTVGLALILMSALPMYLVDRAAKRMDERGIRLWLLVCVAFGVAFITVRGFEFARLNVFWDTNAYGSVVWVIFGVHTFHLLSEVMETAVLAVLWFVGPIGEKQYVDTSDNALYWYFIVLIWVPSYFVLYLAPRVL